MSDIPLQEQDYLVAIKAASALQATLEILDAIVGLATCWIAYGDTQAGADILAFVLRQPEITPETYALAEEHWLELESRICPRVLFDAKAFAQEITLPDMLAYVFAHPSD